RLREFSRDQLRVARLQREVDLHEAHYRKYADNLEQLQIDGALEAEKISNISIVQPATYDAKPVRPRPLLNLGLGLLFALLGGLGLALLLASLDPSLKTPEEVEQRLGLPALASIPYQSPRLREHNGKG